MKKIFISFLLLSSANSQVLNELHTQENIRKFADYLFDEKDYLRSVFEYEKLPANDTIQFKIAAAYQEIKKYDIALEKFNSIQPKSAFFDESQNEYYKTLFLKEDYSNIQSGLTNKNDKEFQRLLYLSYLFTPVDLPSEKNFLKYFPTDEEEKLRYFYNHKKEPTYKSSFVSGIMSAVIPGSGKIYLGEIGDGITAFIATSLLAFLAYDNFSHNHNFRGWLFAGLGTFFYAGNIYGSVVGAKLYNAKVDYQNNSDLKEYLKSKNYFLPGNDFIK